MWICGSMREMRWRAEGRHRAGRARGQEWVWRVIWFCSLKIRFCSSRNF
jgi:hypothetical protein